MKSVLCLAVAATIAAAGSASAGELIGVDANKFYNVDMSTGAKTLISTIPANGSIYAALAYDAANNIVYASSTTNDNLYTIDIANGVATLVGNFNIVIDGGPLMHGMEYDSSTGKLYGMATRNGGLYEINKSTGNATLIGASDISAYYNLGFNSTTGVMYATESSNTDSLYTVNLATGALTLVGALGGASFAQGLAYNPDNGNMYMVDTNSDNLYTIDMTTGASTLIGSTGSGNMIGLVYIPSPGAATLLAAAGLLGARRRR